MYHSRCYVKIECCQKSLALRLCGEISCDGGASIREQHRWPVTDVSEAERPLRQMRGDWLVMGSWRGAHNGSRNKVKAETHFFKKKKGQQLDDRLTIGVTVLRNS